MKKILVMMALALSAIVAQAFEPYYYKFQVAGIKVTNENCDNITGSNIKSGTVKYLVSENTLVFTDVTIERTGSYNRALLNEGCNGLTVKFVGTNKLIAEDAAPLRFEINTTITCEAGGRVIVKGGDQDAVFVTKDAELFVKDADMTVTATSSSAFKGDGGKEIVRFSNSDVSATGSTAAVKDFYYVMAGASYLFLSCTKTSNRVVNNLENLMLTSNMNYTVPAGAKFDSSQKTIVDSFNSPVKGEVYLTPVAPVYINNTTFPDINFRNYLLSTTAGSDSYLSGEEILGITSLNVMGKAINNLKGIEYLPRINTLYCSGNALTTVDLSKNTRLTYLEICNNNINGEGAENLVNNLPTVKKAEMWVYSQGSAGGRVDYNVFTPEQAATMETKGWIPLYYHKWLNLRVRFEGMTAYPIKVSKMFVHSLNSEDVLWDGAVNYQPKENVLTLDNATIYSEKQGIIADVEGLKIKVKGTNLIGTVSPTYTIDFEESQGVVLEGEEGSTLSLESSQHLSGIGLFTHSQIANPGLTIRNCDITIPERGMIQNDNNDVPLIIDNSRIYINNGYIQTAPSLTLKNCHIAKPAGGRVEVYEIVGSDGKTWEGELEILPGTSLRGDVNGDGFVNGADVTALYGYLLDGKTVAGNPDVSGEGVVSGADVTALYNLLLQ